MSYEKYFKEITKLEKNHFSEDLIRDYSIALMDDAKWDIDACYDINDVLIYKGYSFRMEIPKKYGKKVRFDKEYYGELVKNVTKSVSRTRELMMYLNKLNYSQISLASLNFIKIKHLFALGYFKDTDNPYFEAMMEHNLYNTYFLTYTEPSMYAFRHAKKYIENNVFSDIGISYCDLSYMEFRLDIEYLLYTIKFSYVSKDYYKKINTLKVALNITPSFIYEWDSSKIYYYKNIAKYFNDCFKYIDKDSIEELKNKYDESFINDLDNTGYKLLFMLL